MRYEVRATVTEVYHVEADSMDEALEIASEMLAPDEMHHQGFDQVINLDTNEERIF